MNILQDYIKVTSRFPMNMPVKVGGKEGHICGRSFVHERYDVVFSDHTILPSLPRDLLEPNWQELRK